MRIHLINPSHIAFGLAVITPRWLYVLAHATPRQMGRPEYRRRERSSRSSRRRFRAGDIVGIGIHTGNALRGYEVGRLCRERGAYVVYGGIHASLYPDEALERGGATRRGQRRRRRDLAAGARRRRGRAARADLRGRPGGRRLAAEGALGPDAARPVHVGLGPRPCADVRSTAPSARSGGPTGRNPASGPSTPWWKRSSSCAGWASASSRWPTTTSTR